MLLLPYRGFGGKWGSLHDHSLKLTRRRLLLKSSSQNAN